MIETTIARRRRLKTGIERWRNKELKKEEKDQDQEISLLIKRKQNQNVLKILSKRSKLALTVLIALIEIFDD